MCLNQQFGQIEYSHFDQKYRFLQNNPLNYLPWALLILCFDNPFYAPFVCSSKK